MNAPLPGRELREILGGRAFLRLYGPDTFVFVSDAPRRVTAEELAQIRHSMREKGFDTQESESGLLLIDLQSSRWDGLLNAFPRAGKLPLPKDDRLAQLFALHRLLRLHPSAFQNQPMEPVRAVMKQFGRKDGLPALAPRLLEQCAQRLRRNEPLPSALADVLAYWLLEQQEEARS
jgi:hypothetical protein